MLTAKGVFNVDSDRPNRSDRIFVDTNVWLTFTYSTASIRGSRAAQSYSQYLKACIRAGASLFYSPLTFSELAHNIEKFVCDTYNKSHPGLECSPKQFRTGTGTRADVTDEVKDAWNQVKSMALHLITPIDASAMANAEEIFEKCPVDGYDAFFINAMEQAGIDCILTDDADFLHVPNLKVFTANERALREAGLYKKLKTR